MASPQQCHRPFTPPQWLVDSLCDSLVKLWTKIARCGRDTLALFQSMHQRHPWIWFLVKAAAAVIAFVGVLVAFYYSRSGQQIAEKSNAIGRESNEGAIKSICTGSVRE